MKYTLKLLGETLIILYDLENEYPIMNEINIVLTKGRIVVLLMSIEENMDKSLDESDKRALSLQKEVN